MAVISPRGEINAMAETRDCLLSSGESTAAGAVLDLQEKDLPAATTPRAESMVSSDPIPAAPKHPNPKREEIIEESPAATIPKIIVESPAATIPKIIVESPAAICVCVAPQYTNLKILSDDIRRVLESNDFKEILLEKIKEKMKGGNTNGRGGSSKMKITLIVMFAVGLTLYVSARLHSHYLVERLGLLILLVSSLIVIINLWWP